MGSQYAQGGTRRSPLLHVLGPEPFQTEMGTTVEFDPETNTYTYTSHEPRQRLRETETGVSKLEKTAAELRICRHCYALVRSPDMDSHRQWHVGVEDLEQPTSEFGFWDDEGRWNANSTDW